MACDWTEGQPEGMREALRRIILARFGTLPEPLDRRIATADQDTLEQLLERAVKVQSLDDL